MLYLSCEFIYSLIPSIMIMSTMCQEKVQDEEGYTGSQIIPFLLKNVKLLLFSRWSRVRLCNPMDCSTPLFPVLHYLLEFDETHVYWWCHPAISSFVITSPPALNLSQHQGLFQGVGSSHQVAKVLETDEELKHRASQRCGQFGLGGGGGGLPQRRKGGKATLFRQRKSQV